MASAPKRLKTDQPPSRRLVASSDAKNDKAASPVGGFQIPTMAQISGFNLRVQQAKNFAIAQAQEDGCTGNYRIFDSPFGNFLVPVIPSRADLSQ